jgi:hypothetical protein
VKKFSKLILEKKREKWDKHPLVNPVDWDEVFNPLIEHIRENLKGGQMLRDGVFSSKTKVYLDELIDSITEDYVEYYQDHIDDGSQDSFFNAYDINCKFEDIIDCTQHLRDKSKEIDEWPSWDGGYYHMNLDSLRYENTNELIGDVLDVYNKLKIFKPNFKITVHTDNQNALINDQMSEDKIISAIKNILELPGQSEENWINGLTGISICIYNKQTVQSVDL